VDYNDNIKFARKVCDNPLKQSVRILLTGVGSPAASGVIKSLRFSNEYKFHIVGIDCNPEASGYHLVDQSFVCPRATELSFIPTILEICRNERIDILFSLVTSELEKISSNREEFRKLGTKILISQADTIRQTIHKGSLYDRLRTMGIAVPNFRMVQDCESFIKAIQDLGYPDQPVCFKPTISDGSRGFHILDANVDRYHLVFREKPNSAYITYNELLEVIQGHTELPELLVMEYMPNEEFSIDILANDGKVIIAVPRLREMTVGGITTKGVIRNEPDIIAYATTIIERLQLHGIIGVQVRRDVNRNPKIVEINPRIQGTIVHCTAAGINLPLLAVKQAFGIQITEHELNVQWGTRMVRYWEEVFYDANGSSYAL
jgi:carbamoyl-phosphate synthase large subunit